MSMLPLRDPRVAVLPVLLALAGTAAAVEINQASRAELEAITGIGPDMAARMLSARISGPFKNWNDLRARVKGIGQGSARRWSSQGLTVDGNGYEGPPPGGATASGDARP